MRIESRCLAPRTTGQADQATFAAMDQSHASSRDSPLLALGRDSLATLPEAAMLRMATLEVRYGPFLRSDASSPAAWSPPTSDSGALPDILSYLRISDRDPQTDPLARGHLERQMQNAFEHEP